MRKYTEEEAKKSSIDYFEGDELAGTTWLKKYALRNSEGELLELNPDMMHRRLAKEFARIEANYPNGLGEDEIYETFKGFKRIIPQGSPMYGIGNVHSPTSLSNCFVIGNEYDSYGSIALVDQQIIQLSKRRGGVGTDLSHIRPKGSIVKNAASTSTGIVPFMERYSNTLREVGQDGRRAAGMLSISVLHPESENFIDAKLEQKKVTGANISVKITDGFMDAVINNKQFKHQYPVESLNPLVVVEKSATKLWKKIIYNAWKSAEPGIIFIDTAIRESPADCYSDFGFKSITTNPCFIGSTVVAVADGRNGVSIKELADNGDDVLVYSSNDKGELEVKTMRNPRKTGSNVEIYKILLDNGSEILCTKNHRFYLKNGKIKEAIDLINGDSLHILSKVKLDDNNGRRYILNSNGFNEYEHRFLYRNLIGDIGTNDVHHIDENPYNNSIDNLKLSTKSEHNIEHNKSYPGELNPNYSNLSHDELRQFATNLTQQKGSRLTRKEWYGAGGIAWSKYRIEEFGTISNFFLNISLECFDDINLSVLEPRTAKIYKNAIINGYKTQIIQDKAYVEKVCEHCKEKFIVEYSNREQSYCKVSCSINQLNNKKWNGSKDNLINIDSDTYNHKVISVTFHGYDDVYNGTVDDNHNFFTGGFKSTTRIGLEKVTYCLSANCGEIFLSAFDSCRLLLHNLYGYVVNPFTDESYFDFELFRKDARISQRFMDDLIDLELEKLDVIINKIISDPEPDEIKSVELNLWKNIRASAVKGRRSGLGITAEGDMLAALGLRYGTDEATEFAIKVQKTLAIESYKSSIEMAEERGAFPIWNYELEKENPFINRLINVEYDGIGIDVEKYKRFGRRNIANLTIPPAGTTSIMTSTTSGIEPLFMATYKRRRKTEDKSKSTFVDEIGDMWEEFTVFHKQFITWYNIFCKTNNLECKPIETISDDELRYFYELSPYYLATANDVDWVKKVEMQGGIQLFNCHSISCTVNLPSTATIDTINDIYITAFKSGCKGITVYRDGCRSGVMVSKDEKKDESGGIVYHDAPKRVKVLNCDIHTKTIKGQPWTVLVGLDKDKPYEVFAYEQLPNHDFPIDITKGTLTRVGKQHYMLKATKGDKEYRVENIISLLSSEEQSQTRSFSRELRHGIHPKFIVSDIDKDALITSFKRVIARTLKLYIQDNEKGGTCSECGGTLRYEGGCNICPDCGNGKCG